MSLIHELSSNGNAGIVLANGSMNSNTGGEGASRQKPIEDGVVDCMVALPAQLFYNTMIPACLWFLARNRASASTGSASSPLASSASAALHPELVEERDRSNELLFIDARNLGVMKPPQPRTDRCRHCQNCRHLPRLAGRIGGGFGFDKLSLRLRLPAAIVA